MTALYGNQYPRLRGRALNGNNLREFCLPSRVFTPLLKKIVLSENKLTTIQLPPKDFYDMGLKLRYNPWHCDKFMGWVRQCSFTRFHLTCPRGVTLDLLTCDRPANLKGMSPQDVGKICEFNTWNRLPHSLFLVVILHQSSGESINKAPIMWWCCYIFLCLLSNLLSKH